MLISILKNFTKGKDLIRPGVTRFATAYLTLNCLNDNKAALMSMFSSKDWKLILRLVDSDEKPAMGFIYEGMSSAKEKIKSNFGNVKKSYELILKIIDEMWEGQLHRPLHAAAYYLNLHFHYDPNFKGDDADIKQGLYNCMGRLVFYQTERNKISV
ncbi:hypothetical protein Cni_G29518 [Canna indica]|uniref:Uncharacterized protein n=1 Tax=Canna indica TaxID=4628 RepID=A0AAQ3L4J1_9LILI|nr:hypothetical protein Cni_G29518 [Canna indica]